MTPLYWRLTRRYLLGRKGRSLMTLLGIALGVTMVVAVALTNGAILSSYRALLDGVAGRADLQVTPSAGFGFPATLLAEVASVPGVQAAVPAVASGTPVVAGDRQGVATFYGIDPERDGLVRTYRLLRGRLIRDPGEVAVTNELADGLGLGPGSKLQLLSTRGLAEYTVVGVFDARGTVRGALGPFGVLDLAGAQHLFGKEGKLDTIDIRLAPGAGREAVAQAIGRRLDGRARVGTPRERSRDMQKVLDSVVFSLTMAGSISLLAGAFIIYTNVSMGVAERRRDLSILRALGMRRAEVLTLVLGEAALLGALGAGLGLAWGYGLSSTLAREMTGSFLSVYGLQAARVTLGPADAALALAVGTGVALAAAYAPAREAVRVSPVEAMRPAEIGANGADGGGRLRALAGLGLVGAAAAAIWATWPDHEMLPPLVLRAWGLLAALALLGTVVMLPPLLGLANRYLLRPLQVRCFGITGRLAADNAVRQPRRTAATVCALMVSLTFMVGMGGMGVSQRATFNDWFRRTVGWDLNVSTSFAGLGAQVEMDPGLVQELAGVPGVRLVSPQKMGRTLLGDGEPAFLQAFDHRLLRQYSQMPLEQGQWSEAMDAMARGGAAIISPAVARRLNLGLGDPLPLPTPAGVQQFRVVAIMKDVTPYGGTVQVDWQDYTRYWQDQTASNVAVLVHDQAEIEAVRQAILDRLGRSANLQVRSNHEFWSELQATYDGYYRLVDGLVWMSICVSGLAIANTLFASILERRREFGILRAMGARRGEVMRVVLGEALSTGLVGGALGVAAGLALQALFVASTEFINGSAVDMAIPWAPVGTAVAVAVLLAPLAGLWPARWAARLDVVEALRYE